MKLSDRKYKLLITIFQPQLDRVTIEQHQNSYRITVINLVVNRVVNRSDTAFLRRFVKCKFVKCQIVKKSSIGCI
ncbi:hypothetical protein AVDCRST_MAG84-1471 [uncultured Microcoleus sp.]|uniref:Uncharacterized protein n=1 Tax=uncultured Microcoleus sp. TaxID=259945 RepID=A0A6J4L5V4_9CYAN|nr:hypothetical protein AVDCRST_MAG84-1471 [uncultured Microcoleus sp.]